MKKPEYLYLRGRADWAKVTGPARPHTGLPKYNKGPYWSVDLTPDEETRDLLNKHGLSDKLRDPKGKDERTESYLSLKILENRTDGTKNQPPRIVDARGKPWNGSLIGNGSIVDIKVKVVEYDGSEAGVYYQAMRVLDHVPYEAEEFPALESDDEFFSKDVEKTPVSDEDLNDDIPF